MISGGLVIPAVQNNSLNVAKMMTSSSLQFREVVVVLLYFREVLLRASTNVAFSRIRKFW